MVCVNEIAKHLAPRDSVVPAHEVVEGWAPNVDLAVEFAHRLLREKALQLWRCVVDRCHALLNCRSVSRNLRLVVPVDDGVFEKAQSLQKVLDVCETLVEEACVRGRAPLIRPVCAHKASVWLLRRTRVVQPRKATAGMTCETKQNMERREQRHALHGERVESKAFL